jgi:hypothetical protein
MSQTSYTQRFVTAINGQLSCPFQHARLDSKINALAMPAGVFVCRDAADDACKVPSASGDVTATGFGFVKHDMAKEAQQGQTVDFPAKHGVTVMKEGRMWVTCETAAAEGGQVYIRITANGAGKLQLGAVGNVADAGNAIALTGCRFIRTLAAGPGLVEIEYHPYST